MRRKNYIWYHFARHLSFRPRQTFLEPFQYSLGLLYQNFSVKLRPPRTRNRLCMVCLSLTVFPRGVAILGNQLQRLLHLKSRRWSLGANQLSGPKSGLGLSLARRHQRNSALLQRLLARVKIKTETETAHEKPLAKIRTN